VISALTPSDWAQLFLHFLSLSLLAVGGAITTAPDMHRYLVREHTWLTEPQFTSAIALAQAAPGPNVLFVALLGWNVGVNSAHTLGLPLAWPLGLGGVAVTMIAILLPSSLLTYTATRWAHHNRERRIVKAFKQGMAPIVIALLVATGWVLAAAHDDPAADSRLWALAVLATVLVWKTRLHMLWLLAGGAALGAAGWV
jgi:chromate transporter